MDIENKEKLIMVRNLSVQFRQKNRKITAVKDTNFDIYRGEIFSIVGESGSGKTTISRAIAGIEQLKRGTVYMNDKILRGSPPSLLKINKAILYNLKLIQNNKKNINFNLKKIIVFVNLLPSNYDANIKDSFFNKRELQAFQLFFNNLKANYISLLKTLKKILKLQQAIVQFTTGLNNYILELAADLEIAITEGIKNTIDINQQAIWDGSKAMRELIKIEELQDNNLETDDSNKQFLESNFKYWIKFLKSHEKLLDKINSFKLKQELFLLLFLKSKQQKTYFLKLFSGNYLLNNNVKKLIKNLDTELKIAFENKINSLLIDFKIETKILLELMQKADNKKETEKFLLSLPQSNYQETLLKLINNKNFNYLEFKEKLLTIWAYKELDIFVDANLIKNYEELNNKKNSKAYDFIELLKALNWMQMSNIDEIIANATFFKTPTRKFNKASKKQIQMVFQDPYSSLNERISISEVISEGLNAFPEIYKNENVRQKYFNFLKANSLINSDENLDKVKIKKKELKNFLVNEIIKEVGLLPEHLSRYSHEFSGGQRQRIGIARALIMNPQLIIADEPISALDVSIRAQVLNLLKKSQEQHDITYIFIAHDLSVVRFIADRVAVFYKGQIVELANSEDLFNNPLHPYTKALLSAIPVPNPEIEKNRTHFVYNPENEHQDYIYDLPDFIEITSGHYLYGNSREIAQAQTILNEKTKTMEVIANVKAN